MIEPFTKDECIAGRGDRTILPLTWKRAQDLAAVAGRQVKFRFYLRNGSLYSFWVSPDSSGASHGYVAAGGPGFTSAADTVGQAVYEAAKAVMIRTSGSNR